MQSNYLQPFLRQRAIHWPQDIPQNEKVVLQGCHRSEMTCHDSGARNLVHSHRVRLDKHAVVVVDQGFLRVTIDGRTRLIESGEAALLSVAEIELSELMNPGSSDGAFVWFFFDDRLLGDVVSDTYNVFRTFHRFWSHPSDERICVFPKQLVRMTQMFSQSSFEQNLPNLIKAGWNELNPRILKLVLRRVIVPRLSILLFVERLLFHQPTDFPTMIESYPGGAGALRKEIRRLGMGGLKTVVEGCRQSWMDTWRQSGIAPSQISRAFPIEPRDEKESLSSDNLARSETWVLLAKPSAQDIFGESAESNRHMVNDEHAKAQASSVHLVNFKALHRDSLKEMFEETNIVRIPELARWSELLAAA